MVPDLRAGCAAPPRFIDPVPARPSFRAADPDARAPHAGQFTTLRAFVDHYSESDTKLRNFDVMQLEALLRGTVQPTTEAILATRDPLLAGMVFPATAGEAVTAFLTALTDPRARDLKRIAPRSVPSGLPVDGAEFAAGPTSEDF